MRLQFCKLQLKNTTFYRECKPPGSGFGRCVVDLMTVISIVTGGGHRHRQDTPCGSITAADSKLDRFSPDAG